jgi:AbrB family looped-hinge helix DNA binding protein
MASTTLTTKGQTTLPKEIRDRLRLKPGDRLDVVVEGRHVVLTPVTLHVDDLCAILPRAKRVRSMQEMDAAIRRRSAERR